MVKFDAKDIEANLIGLPEARLTKPIIARCRITVDESRRFCPSQKASLWEPFRLAPNTFRSDTLTLVFDSLRHYFTQTSGQTSLKS